MPSQESSRQPGGPSAETAAEDVTGVTENTAALGRQVLRLAVPAFLALIAEPLFLLADTAIVGHLGTAALAGLGVASGALLTAAGLFVFLAYGTTSVVARRIGAGQQREAVSAGVDGIWLAVALGVVTGALTAVFAPEICAVFGASPGVQDEAVTYLRISAIGLPAMLTVLAATGVLRGFQDVRTPLVVASIGFGVNIVLNFLLVYGFDWGIAGSAAGTVLAQFGMALALGYAVLVRARRAGARLRPHPAGVLRAALGGVPLLIRTIALRAALLLTTWVAAGFGDVPLAAHQVAVTVFGFLAFALDALAIAAQAITGNALGAGDVRGTRQATALMVRWGWIAGFAMGALVALTAWVLPPLFTSDEAVRSALTAGLLVVAAIQPIAGPVFVLDGVLIGAGDGKMLAALQVVVLAGYLPLVLVVREVAAGNDGTLVAWLWVAFGGFMVLRLIALAWRARSDAWLVTGA